MQILKANASKMIKCFFTNFLYEDLSELKQLSTPSEEAEQIVLAEYDHADKRNG